MRVSVNTRAKRSEAKKAPHTSPFDVEKKRSSSSLGRDFVKKLSFFTSRRRAFIVFAGMGPCARYVAGTPDTTRRELQLRNRILLLSVTYRKADVYWGDGLLNVIILGGSRIRSRTETKVALSVGRKIFAISDRTVIW